MRGVTLTIIAGWADQEHSPHSFWEIVRSCQCIRPSSTAWQCKLNSLSAFHGGRNGGTLQAMWLFWHWLEEHH